MSEDTRGPRERAYDEHFFPLVEQLIALSKEHGIPLFLDATLDRDHPEGPMHCTTRVPAGATEEEMQRLGWMKEVAKGDDRWEHALRIRFMEYVPGYESPHAFTLITTKG